MDDMGAQPIGCPGCANPMRSLVLERRPFGTEAVDLCASCRAIWFDTYESTQLAPSATITLFRAINDAGGGARTTLPAAMRCPRCHDGLQLTHDVQRTTRFVYYRCTSGHGRLTPFVQFLREKNFVRPLAADELARLKEAVQTVRCSGCGAPIDLATTAACPHCHAPIEIVDRDAAAKALAGLAAQQPASQRSDAKPLDVDLLALDYAIARREYERRPQPGIAFDLVDAGVETLLGLFAH